MSSEVSTTTTGYWYGDGSRFDAVDVLNALRRWRTAESAAQRRARDALGIGENALLALRFLIAAESDGRTVNAKQLAERLEITPASTSALVDRLVRSGHVERRTDPNDRRGVILTASGSSMRQALTVIDEIDTRTFEVAEHLASMDMAVVVEFLEEMSSVVDDIDADRTARRADGPRSVPPPA